MFYDIYYDKPFVKDNHFFRLMTMNNVQRKGTMFIFSAPSGAGKSTVIKRVISELDNVQLSVSVTTRAKRDGEVEGVDYYFITEEKFRELVDKKALYEYVDSDFGPKYGTPREPVDKLLAEGKDIILDIDYPGVVQMRALAADRIKTISLIPPSLKELRERLVNRKTDSIEVIERRMSMAEKRINECVHYDYIVVNDVLDKAVEEVKSIILAARNETKNVCDLQGLIKSVIEEN